MTAEAVAVGPQRPAMQRVLSAWGIATILILASVIAFAWTLHADLQRLFGMTAPAWDFAYDQQVIYNVSIGQGFYSSFARADFLGIHFELILVFLAAVEKFWPSPVVPLIFSSAGLAATAPAGYLFFRALLPENRPESRWLAVGLATPMPFWAAIQEAARDLFHPENMALALAMLAAWAGIRGHRVLMWVLCVLVLMIKEDQVFTVGVIGLLVAAYGAPSVRKHWRFIVYLAGAWFLIAIIGVQSYLRGGGYSDFAYYGWLFKHPTTDAVLQALFATDPMLVVAAVIAAMAALPLLAPRWLLLVLPPYLLSVLSGHSFQKILILHYVLLLLFPLVVAGGVGARNLLARWSFHPAWVLAVMLPALLIGFGAGRFPPSLGGDEPSLYARPDTVAQLEAATAAIPADACVSADGGLTPWLANRHTINDFPDKLSADCYIVLDHDPYISGPTNRIVRQDAVDSLPASGRRQIYDDGRFQVWTPVGG